jgi:FtsP/CotA-like multicopper oxidase with cupredoxin domain
MAIGWRFHRGDVIRLRIANDRAVLHGMQHPIHLHGQRFLVLAVNGAPNDNLAWKDTVLVPSGGTVDLLVDVSNPGQWMLHCHIAEHLEAGMMTTITVD